MIRFQNHPLYPIEKSFWHILYGCSSTSNGNSLGHRGEILHKKGSHRKEKEKTVEERKHPEEILTHAREKPKQGMIDV
jgi:hypothetical protein